MVQDRPPRLAGVPGPRPPIVVCMKRIGSPWGRQDPGPWESGHPRFFLLGTRWPQHGRPPSHSRVASCATTDRIRMPPSRWLPLINVIRNVRTFQVQSRPTGGGLAQDGKLVTSESWPMQPETGYGLSPVADRAWVPRYPVAHFIEKKPPLDVAETQFVASGDYFWTAACFACSKARAIPRGGSQLRPLYTRTRGRPLGPRFLAAKTIWISCASTG